MRKSDSVFAFGSLVVAAVLLTGCTSATTSGTPAAGNGGGEQQATAAATVQITPAETEEASPATPIVVTAKDGTLDEVTITNSAKGNKVKGELSADKLTYTTAEPLGYGSAYQVVASATGPDGKKVEQKGTVNTLKPKSQAYPSFIPAPSITDVGVGQPLVVRFDVDITDKAATEKALTVTSTPAQTGSWYWMSKREVHYRPQVYWKPGTTIKLHAGIYGVNLGGGVYGKTDRDLNLTVHDSWVAKADGNAVKMDIYQNGTLVKTMPISMGKDSTPTHIGTHVISDKKEKYTMDSCTYGVCPPDPKAYRTDEFFALRISNSGEFVHENPASAGSQGSANVSHGCINLNKENASWFFAHFNLGDVVEVTNSGGPALPIYETYGDWSVSWAEWQKGSAIK